MIQREPAIAVISALVTTPIGEEINMTRLEQLAFNSPSIDGFVSEVLKVLPSLEEVGVVTTKDLREMWQRIHNNGEKI